MRMLVSVILIAALLTTTLVAPLAMAQEARDLYNEGFQDGKQDGQSDASLLKIAWGALFGPLAVLYNLLTGPNIPDDRLIRIADQGEDYTSGYLAGYRAGYKQQSVMYNVIGWATWLILAIISSELGERDFENHLERVPGY